MVSIAGGVDMNAEKELPRMAYSVKESMAILGLGRNSIFNLIHSREIQAKRVGRRLIIPKVEIERFLAGK